MWHKELQSWKRKIITNFSKKTVILLTHEVLRGLNVFVRFRSNWNLKECWIWGEGEVRKTRVNGKTSRKKAENQMSDVSVYNRLPEGFVPSYRVSSMSVFFLRVRIFSISPFCTLDFIVRRSAILKDPEQTEGYFCTNSNVLAEQPHYTTIPRRGDTDMLQVKIKFRLKFFNQVYFQFSLSPSPNYLCIRAKRQRKLRINLVYS